ncbi:MAG: AbrB family transcriptional regulator [Bacteroidetes bacterium CG12_big_fil_rev_8_21_14_0_65_60_17]|nr:MAG: AbrB family transcriptional regulator [Bacteroidetes bacterium CG12_big_fil_rev_8_21_14_0_65_60_17]
MATVRVSPKFQVVIPKDIRTSMNIEAGQLVEVFSWDNRIEIVPVRPMEDMRGFIRGMDSGIDREKDREL